MHHPPLNPNSYCGLTVVTDIARHDTKQLLDGQAGLFWESCMAPYSRWLMDIRSSDTSLPLLPNTKAILYLGEDSFKSFRPTTDESVTLNELRGTPVIGKKDGIIRTCSYLPQDAFDRRNYFGGDEDSNSDEENTNEKVSEKSHQSTKRRNFKFWLHSDLRKTVRWVKEGVHINPTGTVEIYPPIEKVLHLLSTRKQSNLYIDIETDKEFNLTCIGLQFKSAAEGSTSIFVIPFKRFTRTLAYEEREIFQFFRALAIAFTQNTVVVWNAVFDLMVLAWKYRVPFPRRVFDGMIAWHRTFPEVEKSLGHAISYLTDLPYHKNEGVFDPHNSYQEQELWNYNSKDIHTLALCHEQLVKVEIPKLKGLEESVIQGNRSIRPYLTMMYKGVRTNTTKLVDRFKDLQLKSAQCDRVLAIITGRKLNPRSSPQVCKYLFDDLGFEEPPEEPTNEKNLLKLLAAHVNKTGNIVPSVRLIIYSRGIKKAASNIKYRQWSNDGGKTYDRLTCSYNVAGPETFRLGSRRLFKWKNDKNTGFGTNCQNRRKDEKQLYIPDEGKVFIKPDQAGAEALIVAWLCRAGNFRNLFLHKIKPHVFVALHLFKSIWERKLSRSMDSYIKARIVDLKTLEGWNEVESMIKESDNWPSDQRYYFIAKQVCHASNYDVKAPTFQMTVLLKSEGSVALSLKQCRELLNTYHGLFPEIRYWHSEIVNEIKNGRVLRNLFGYPRRFTGPWGDDLFKKGYAFKPQSTVGTITNLAITELQERIDDGDKLLNGVDLLVNEHDGLLAQAPIERVEVVSREIYKHMSRELVSPRGEKFRMGVEVKTGYNWSDAHNVYNPEGLKEVRITV